MQLKEWILHMRMRLDIFFFDKSILSLRSNHYYFYFKPECITRIIAGRDMSEEAFNQLKNSVMMHLPNTAVIRYGQGEQDFNG